MTTGTMPHVLPTREITLTRVERLKQCAVLLNHTLLVFVNTALGSFKPKLENKTAPCTQRCLTLTSVTRSRCVVISQQCHVAGIISRKPACKYLQFQICPSKRKPAACSWTTYVVCNASEERLKKTGVNLFQSLISLIHDTLLGFFSLV